MKHKSLEEVLRTFRKNTVDLLPEDLLIQKLKKWLKGGNPLKIKYGADPSRPDLHLGHYVCLKKLKDLQDLGHIPVFIVGDFTALIGDPSGRSKTRPRLSEEEVKENSRTYFEQVYKVLDPEKTEIRFNSEWLAPLKARDVIQLTSIYTVARMLERDDFELRFQQGIPIMIHEFLYPLFQGFDSYSIEADIELGGTDQKFNFLVGREIQKAFGQEPQVILTLPLLEGTDGKLKMSKSYDNYIALTDPPKEMYGKVMSIPDPLILKYFRLVLYKDEDDLKKIKKELEINPRDVKAQLAFEIVSLFYSREEAQVAEMEFNRIFRERKPPTEMPVFVIPEAGLSIIEILASSGFVSSKSEARRLIRQRAVKIENSVVEDESVIVNPPQKSKVLKVGKRRFMKLVGEK